MKIKYLDTGEVVEVTRSEQLVNTKVKVSGPEESRQVQIAVFGMGITWLSGSILAKYFDCPFLFFDSDSRLSCENKHDEKYFKHKDSREFQFISVSSIKEERPAEGWISVEDRPFVKNCEWTADSREEFLAAVPTNKGWWIRHCLLEPETGCLYVCCDDHIESAGWEYTDITHWKPIGEPYTLTS